MFDAIIDFLMRFGAWGLFIHSFIDAIIFPIPAFFLQVPLSMVHPSSAIWFATVGFIASLLGTPIGYLIGKFIGTTMLEKILKKNVMDKASTMLEKNGEVAILVGAFTPIPFKVFTIMAGCLNFSLWKLLAYAALGRAVKFYVVGILFYLYGRTAESMLGNLNYVFMGIGVLLVIVVVILRRRKLKKQNEQSTQ